MSLKIKQLIQEKWREGLAPVVNGILYADGKIFQIDRTCAQKKILKPTETKLEALMAQSEVLWACYDELHSIDISFAGIRIACGEGSWGEDGYIAAIETKKNLLQWVGFFDYTNPFIGLKLQNNSVVATNNLGVMWRFQPEYPELITIVESEDSQ